MKNPQKQRACRIWFAFTGERKAYTGDDADDAIEFANEFNQIEAKKPTGNIAVADVHEVVRHRRKK